MKKKIYFFNGSLGSGKTTLINQIIKEKALTSFFIIENEIANFSVDHNCFPIDPKQIKVLAGECICCGDPFAMQDLLKKLANSNYENILIESSGVASLNQLLINILIDQELENLYEIACCVFVVDALGIQRTSLFDLDVSDFIVVTKFDLVKNIKQEEGFAMFVKENLSENKLIIKKEITDTKWLENFKQQEIKSFRDWSLRVNEGKFHGQNFTHIIKDKDLEKLKIEEMFNSMVNKKILRIKGFYKEKETIMHLEMTPEQMKNEISETIPNMLGVVIIGENKLLLEEFVQKIIN